MYKTNEPLPSKQEIEKRNKVMKELLDSKIVEEKVEEIKEFLKIRGLESTSINLQIFSEFCKDWHQEGRGMTFPFERGDIYFYNTKHL